jgi:REP element-mobilizing transposase RayT
MSHAQIPETGYSELRKGRYSEPNRIYHLTTRTHESFPVFSDFRDARIVIDALRHQHVDGHLESLAFVVMPDHLHWLVQLKGDRSLSTCMNLVKSRSTRRIHDQGTYRGKVWQRGFYDRALRKEEDLVSAARYIVANPLRAGLVRSVREYPFWDAKWLKERAMRANSPPL